jgi:hypothetical protein
MCDIKEYNNKYPTRAVKYVIKSKTNDTATVNPPLGLNVNSAQVAVMTISNINNYLDTGRVTVIWDEPRDDFYIVVCRQLLAELKEKKKEKGLKPFEQRCIEMHGEKLHTPIELHCWPSIAFNLHYYLFSPFLRARYYKNNGGHPACHGKNGDDPFDLSFLPNEEEGDEEADD